MLTGPNLSMSYAGNNRCWVHTFRFLPYLEDNVSLLFFPVSGPYDLPPLSWWSLSPLGGIWFRYSTCGWALASQSLPSESAFHLARQRNLDPRKITVVHFLIGKSIHILWKNVKKSPCMPINGIHTSILVNVSLEILGTGNVISYIFMLYMLCTDSTFKWANDVTLVADLILLCYDLTFL